MNRFKFTLLFSTLIVSSLLHAQVDYRNYQSPVKNQVNRGTCTAFAIIAALETFPGFPTDLSEQYMYYLAKSKSYNKSQDFTQGAFLVEYINVLQSSGTLREDQAPYNPNAPVWDKNESNFEKFKKSIQGSLYEYLQLNAFAYKLRPSSYTHLQGDKAKDVEFLKKLLDGGTRAIPVGYALSSVYWASHPATKEDKIDPKAFVRLFENEKPIGFKVASLKYGLNFTNKIMDGTITMHYSSQETICNEGHAVAIVGYDENGFLIKNSWGTELFGTGGYGWLSFDYHRLFAMEALALHNGEIVVYDGLIKEDGGWKSQDFYLKSMPSNPINLFGGERKKGISISIVYHGESQMPRFSEITYEVYDDNDKLLETKLCSGDVFDYRSNGFERIILNRSAPTFPSCKKIVAHFKTSKGITFSNTYYNIEAKNQEYKAL